MSNAPFDGVCCGSCLCRSRSALCCGSIDTSGPGGARCGWMSRCNPDAVLRRVDMFLQENGTTA